MRILVVEDEPKIAGAIKRGLEQEAYAVDIALDGDEGMASAVYDPHDLVILDRMLPGDFDGLDIARKLRSKGSKVPILMLTAKDAVSDRVAGLDAGADDYLIKPFAFEELLARVRALLRRPEQKAQTKLSYYDLELDTAQRSVHRSGKAIDLTLKEYSLLQYLMRNSEVLLSKQQIIEHVWNFDSDILPNTVEVFMGYLRTKVEKPFKGRPQLLHTKRGFGYILKTKDQIK